MKILRELLESIDDERVAATIREITDEDVASVESYRDPEHPGIYAVKFTLVGHEDDPITALVDINDPDEYQEANFATWPPKRARTPNPFY